MCPLSFTAMSGESDHALLWYIGIVIFIVFLAPVIGSLLQTGS